MNELYDFDPKLLRQNLVLLLLTSSLPLPLFWSTLALVAVLGRPAVGWLTTDWPAVVVMAALEPIVNGWEPPVVPCWEPKLNGAPG